MMYVFNISLAWWKEKLINYSKTKQNTKHVKQYIWILSYVHKPNYMQMEISCQFDCDILYLQFSDN